VWRGVKLEVQCRELTKMSIQKMHWRVDNPFSPRSEASHQGSPICCLLQRRGEHVSQTSLVTGLGILSRLAQ
uniref:Uncharacterized protein n=1 Tax=Chlorocebus sabaeus TaxID=60711 RepID=A0A0D9R2E1_CHLSB